MPIKLIGRATNCKGKPLWEILANLRNFGVGRIVLRSILQRYPEPCYMKILKVAAMPPTNEPYTDRKVIVLADVVFRGMKESTPMQLDNTTYKADFVLVPKDQEHLYTGVTVPPAEKRVLPRTMEFPPLYLQMLMRDIKAKGIAEPAKQPQLNIVYNTSCMSVKNYRIAEEDETAASITYGLNKSSVFYPKTEASEPS
ncbi:PREDICTED: uncharacterized protein LOC106745884 [Dinoponera quadriceps]|uniref:Uncharacterized protein LOC106745884 n=1 Tax=Dinoponera quadriceps TaxID=609295 RepID=A0A6P3XG12_DINQU|nr:PREDICTED: uncharacterized protein LOC106745884 [Dinoponera quadriceps]